MIGNKLHWVIYAVKKIFSLPEAKKKTPNKEIKYILEAERKEQNYTNCNCVEFNFVLHFYTYCNRGKHF